MYYKVCFVTDKKLVSFATFGQHRVEYKIGRVTKPTLEGSYLFVFDDLQMAKSIAGSNDQIYSCKITGETTKFTNQAMTITEYSFEDFWKGTLTGKITSLIPHTVLCETVELIEKV